MIATINASAFRYGTNRLASPRNLQTPQVNIPSNKLQLVVSESPDAVSLGVIRPTLAAGPTSLQQARAIVAQAHAAISQMANGTTPIGESQATALIAVVDSTIAQLQAIGQADPADPALGQYVQSTLADLQSARAAYAALAGDIRHDASVDQHIWQQANQQVGADTRAEGQGADQAVLDATVGVDEQHPWDKDRKDQDQSNDDAF